MVNLESLTPDGRDQQMGKQGTQTSEASFTSSEPQILPCKMRMVIPTSSRLLEGINLVDDALNLWVLLTEVIRHSG